MNDIKVMKSPFLMCNIKHTPSYLPPYSFVISMQKKLTLICPADDVPIEANRIYDTFSCFVLEECTTDKVIKSTNEFSSVLAGADIDMTLVLVNTTAYIFVKADDAMQTIIHLSSMGYDVKYRDLFEE